MSDRRLDADPGLLRGAQGPPVDDHTKVGRREGLTILVRGRNQRAFLPGAMRSALDTLNVLEREGCPGEVVVIDDASLDGSQKLLRSVQALYDEPQLRILCQRERVDPARLRVLGLQASRFRYVCVMNADDELVPANVPLFLRSASETGAAMVYGNVINKKDGEVVGVRSNMPAVPGVAKSRQLDIFSVVNAEKLAKSEEVAATDASGPEGWQVALRLLSEGEGVVFVPAVLGYHQQRAASTGGDLRSAGGGASSQADTREEDVQRIGRIYHPEVGFIDE